VTRTTVFHWRQRPVSTVSGRREELRRQPESRPTQRHITSHDADRDARYTLRDTVTLPLTLLYHSTAVPGYDASPSRHHSIIYQSFIHSWSTATPTTSLLLIFLTTHSIFRSDVTSRCRLFETFTHSITYRNLPDEASPTARLSLRRSSSISCQQTDLSLLTA